MLIRGHRIPLLHNRSIADGSSLVVQLTTRATRACGHLLPAGTDGDDAARKLRAEIRSSALALAAGINASQLVIYARGRGAEEWLIDECDVRGAA